MLYESNLNQICDFVIAVIADRNKQINRVMKRDGITKEEAEKRLNAQNSNEFFTENAEYIIYNNEDIKNIEEQIAKIKI